MKKLLVPVLFACVAGFAAAAGAAPSKAAVPDGKYRCYTYHPGAVLVGAIDVEGGKYRADRGGAAGTIRVGTEGRVEFAGKPPLGFAVGVLEEREPKPKLRLYISAADIGNKWKAAVCTGGTANKGATASGPAAGGKSAFAAGAKIEATYIGYWYPGTIIRCDGERCLVHYDDPSSKDEWVDTSRLRLKK